MRIAIARAWWCGGVTRRVTPLISLFLVCWMPAVPAYAQHRPYRVDHWTTDNGLPQNTIRAIVQTRDGYLWLTTFDGLARFDGVRFTVFDRSNTPAITNNRFTALREGQDGTLWAVGDQGEVVGYRDGVFTGYAPPQDFPKAFFAELTTDAQGDVVVITERGWFYPRGGTLVASPRDQSDDQVRPYRGASGSQWTLDSHGAISVSGSRSSRYPIALDFSVARNDLWPFEDSQGQLWIGDRTALYVLREGRTTRHSETSGVPPDVRLRPQCEDAEGGVWFTTGPWIKDGPGVVRFKDGRFTSYADDIGLPVANYNQIISDREGSIWVATSRGLYRLRPELIKAYSKADGLPHDEVYPLLQTRGGQIWVGTIHGLGLFDGRTFVRHPLSHLDELIQSLWEDRAGRLWIGVYGGWLFRYAHGKIDNLTPPQTRNAPVWAIQEDRAGAIWVATERGIVTLENDRVVRHFTMQDGLPSDDVKAIHESVGRDGKSVLWFGTYGGLAKLEDGRFTSFTSSAGLAGNRVRSIHEDADGTLWIGTYDDGMSRLRDGKFFTYRTEQGLYNNGVFQILEDRHDNFWISCNKGIYRVSRRELNDVAEGRLTRLHSADFGKADGLLNTESNGGRQPAGFVAQDGKLWFPTMGGVAVVEPEAARFNHQPPPVLIESVMLQRKAVSFRDGIRLAPGERDIEIAYTGLSLVKSERVAFRYRLEGLSDDWVEAGTRRMASFPYLEPGTYTFRVVAANSDGVWNSDGAALRIVVEAPFYRTAWFISLVVVAAAATAHQAYRSRIAQLQKRREQQEAFSRRLIESQEADRKRIAAELHDGLGQSLLVIKNRALVGGMSPEDAQSAKEQFDEINLSASQAIDEARRIAYDLRPYHLDRLGLTQSLEEMVERVAASTSTHFTVKVALLDGVFTKEQEAIFYRIVQESVSNIVKHSRATEASVTVHREEESVTLTVQDNGQGFADTGRHLPSGMSASPGSGFGLIGLAERVRMLDGEYSLRSAPTQGTTITLTFPVR